MSFYYFLWFLENIFDIRIIVGLSKMLKTAENPSKKQQIFNGFLAIFNIFETPGKVWISKSDQKKDWIFNDFLSKKN